MKKKIIVLITALFIAWAIVGIAARRNILSLIAEQNEENIIKYEDFVFGVRFNSQRNELSSGVIWLDEDENIALRKCLSNAKFGGCISSDNHHFLNEQDFVSGTFYLTPCWAHELGIKRILQPLLHKIDMFYWRLRNKFSVISPNHCR